MKKLSVLSLACLLLNGMHAEEKKVETTRVNKNVDVQKTLESAKVVRYSVTMYRGENYDEDAWKETVAQTAKIIELGSSEGNEAEFVESIVSSIQRMYTRRNVNDGVHGQIKVGLGDGACACGDSCDCAEKYKGLCPCSALDGSDCKREKLKCPGHPAA